MTASVINATVNGINATGGNTAELELQVGGTTAITVNSAGYWVLANALPAASGGTGINAAGTTGNVLTSNGTAWLSQAPAAGTRISGGSTGLTPNTLTSGDVTLSGTLAVANGGTGSTTATFSGANITSLNASSISSGTLAVGRGGTGAATLTANNVIIGNGTSAVTFVAPGTTGNVLTSNGTVWASSAPPTPSSSVGAVGTYALLRNTNNTTLNAGDTVSGGLEYANSGGSSSGSASGTWRCMGYTEGGAGNARITTVFLRIS